jgi:hypothetical protein
MPAKTKKAVSKKKPAKASKAQETRKPLPTRSQAWWSKEIKEAEKANKGKPSPFKVTYTIQ